MPGSYRSQDTVSSLFSINVLSSVSAQAGLTLHPQKTRIVDAAQEAFDFLGYRFSGGKRWPRDKSLKKLKDAIRLLASTRRQAGRRRVTTAKAWESSSRM